MRSKDKFSAWIVPMYGKLWVKIFFREPRIEFVPSFEDLFRMIRLICHCEEEKYPRGKGARMVGEFLADCCKPRSEGQTIEERWQELREKYRIPDRA